MAMAAREQFEDARNACSTRESVEERLRTARRAIVEARRASEDALDDATLRIRRHPFGAVGGAAFVGFAVGSLGGFIIGFFARRRSASV